MPTSDPATILAIRSAISAFGTVNAIPPAQITTYLNANHPLAMKAVPREITVQGAVWRYQPNVNRTHPWFIVGGDGTGFIHPPVERQPLLLAESAAIADLMANPTQQVPA